MTSRCSPPRRSCAGSVPCTRETLTSLAPPDERTRFYPPARTQRIAHGLTELLRDTVATGPRRALVIERVRRGRSDRRGVDRDAAAPDRPRAPADRRVRGRGRTADATRCGATPTAARGTAPRSPAPDYVASDGTDDRLRAAYDALRRGRAGGAARRPRGRAGGARRALAHAGRDPVSPRARQRSARRRRARRARRAAALHAGRLLRRGARPRAPRVRAAGLVRAAARSAGASRPSSRWRWRRWAAPTRPPRSTTTLACRRRCPRSTCTRPTAARCSTPASTRPSAATASRPRPGSTPRSRSRASCPTPSGEPSTSASTRTASR